MAALSDIDLLARLVSYDSVSSVSNRPIADFVCDYLRAEARGTVRIDRDESGDGSKVNVIASCGPAVGQGDRAGLTMCGHLDVVPAQEPEWESDPFTLTERDGALIARGAADMKGFDALAINLLLDAAQQPEQLQHPLAVVLTFDEEFGSLGAKHLVDHWPGVRELPRHCIIGEPTSLQAVRMHKGHFAIRVSLRGKAAHSGSPHLGHNAIEPARKVLLALSELREQFENMRAETSRYFPAVPYPVINVAAIHGGDAINVVPDTCIIDVGVRPLPDQSEAELTDVIVQHLQKARNGMPIDIEVVRSNPSMLTEDSAPLHKAITELVGQHESIGVSYGSDGGWLSTAGFDTVLFGPGTIEVAHKPNEALPVAEFRRGRQLLESLIARFCCGAAD